MWRIQCSFSPYREWGRALSIRIKHIETSNWEICSFIIYYLFSIQLIHVLKNENYYTVVLTDGNYKKHCLLLFFCFSQKSVTDL